MNNCASFLKKALTSSKKVAQSYLLSFQLCLHALITPATSLKKQNKTKQRSGVSFSGMSDINSTVSRLVVSCVPHPHPGTSNEQRGARFTSGTGPCEGNVRNGLMICCRSFSIGNLRSYSSTKKNSSEHVCVSLAIAVAQLVNQHGKQQGQDFFLVAPSRQPLQSSFHGN